MLLPLVFHCLTLGTWVAAAARSADISHRVEAAPHPTASCTAINDPPSGATCGQRGSLGIPAYAADAQEVDTIDDCRSLCSRHGAYPPRPGANRGCYVFGYNNSTHICNLYYDALTDMEFTPNPNSFVEYDSMDCFNCSSPCPHSIDAVLLDNGDFDYGLLDGPWTTIGGKVGNPGGIFRHAFICSSPACSLSQFVPVCPNESYRLFIRYSRNPRPVSLSLSAGNLYGYDHFPSPGDRGSLARYDFNHGTSGFTQLMLNFTNATGLTVYDVRLLRVAGKFRPAPGAPELVINGGFESGQLAPFVFNRSSSSYNYTIVSPGINGSLHAILLNGNASAPNANASINQQISNLDPGMVYLLQLTTIKQKNSAQFPVVTIGGLSLTPPSPLGQRYSFIMPFMARHRSLPLSIAYSDGPLLIDNISIQHLND